MPGVAVRNVERMDGVSALRRDAGQRTRTVLRLLVIEDRLSDFELIQGQLERQGIAARLHRVDTTEDLVGALNEGGWDAVLTDYSIPGMEFRHTVSRVRARRPEVPILLVSGYMGEDQAAALLTAGIDDFVLKYRPARLGSAIQRAVTEAREQQARRAAENGLRESEQRLRLALHAAALGMVRFDCAAGIFHLDGRAQQQFELSATVEAEALRARIMTDDWARIDAALARAAEPDSDGRYAVDFRLRAHDGSLRWLSSSGCIRFGPGGHARERVSIVQDVTPRKQAEAALRASEERLAQALGEMRAANERLENEVDARTAELRRRSNYLLALIDNVPFRVWLKDTQGRFLAVNRAHAARHGRTPQQIVGKTDFDLVDEETAHEHLARDREVMASRRPATWEVRMNGPDIVGWVESYKAPVFDAGGNVLGTIGYARDIAERTTTSPARSPAAAAPTHGPKGGAR